MTEKNVEDYLRVTEVLATYAKLDQIPPHVLENACFRGETVHQICTAMLNGIGIPEVQIEFQGYVDAFVSWRESSCLGAEFTFPERFWDDDLGVTGECDCIMQASDGMTYLIDFKTSASESKTWPLQGAAYKYLAKSCNIDANKIVFLQLKKDGTYKSFSYDYEENINLFLKALDLHKYFNAKKRKRNT